MGSKSQKSKNILSPFGHFYIQGGGKGVCSYHFEDLSKSKKGSYCDFSNTKKDPDWPLDSGNYPPDKMYFKD